MFRKQDLRPTASDDKHISQAFPVLIAEMIARYTPGSHEWPERDKMLSEIKNKMPSDRPLKAKKTDARPLGVFDVNEGSKKGLVQVLDAIRERIAMTSEMWAGKVRVILGDWLTSSNLRAARRALFHNAVDFVVSSLMTIASIPFSMACSA